MTRMTGANVIYVSLLWCILSSVDSVSDVAEDALVRVPDLIAKNGYPAEVHHVVTKDGYILEMHRIPFGVLAGPSPDKPVVFLQHGLLSSSADWIITGPSRALGYALADSGFDVWLGNNRGTFYSRRHETLSPDDRRFWDYTFHEIGVYDVPAMIDYILLLTGHQRLFYVGHSQGTTVFFVMTSTMPAYNYKIRAMIGVAPVAYRQNLKCPYLRANALIATPTTELTNRIGYREFAPRTRFLATVGKQFCSDRTPLTQRVCADVVFRCVGYNRANLNVTLLPLLFGHAPAGVSNKQLIHFSQEINSGKFSRFDYGQQMNLKMYGRPEAPEYNVSKMTARVALFYSVNDGMSSSIDVNRLYDQLPNPIGKYLVSNPLYNHIDFIWGTDAREVLYSKMINLMRHY